MFKNSVSKKQIEEKLNKIENVIPKNRPFIIFIEKKEGKWNITEQYKTFNKNVKVKNFIIDDINNYMAKNSDIPILVDYNINDNNLYEVCCILFKLAKYEEINILFDYMIENIKTHKKNIKFTRYLIKLSKKYKNKFGTVNLERPFDKLSVPQLKKLKEILEEEK